MSFMGITLLLLANLAGGILSFTFFSGGSLIAGTLVTIITLLTDFVFIPKKAYPYRFMFPGLITFLVFMIFPILFTIYIGFTNLSTGHFLSYDAAKKILLSEFTTKAEAHPISFELFKNNNEFTILVGNLMVANFEFSSRKRIKLSVTTTLPTGQPLQSDEVYALKDSLQQLVFITPEDNHLSYYRTDYLLEKTPKYIEHDDSLLELKSSLVFSPNYKTGYFENGENRLAPGFYVNVGFKNFLSLLSDSRIKGPFFKVFLWTLSWAFFSVLTTFILGMFLALILNDDKLKLKPVYRTLLIIPYSIPFFISVLIFKGMMNQDFGILNEMLASISIDRISWLSNPTWAKISALIVNLWLGFPYMFLVTTGILQSIPKSVYEAAKLDGAKKWRTFKSITLPLIMSAIGPLLVGSFAFNLNNFVGIYLLTGGLPPMQGVSTPVGETDILISYTYRLAFEGGRGQDFGLASSIAIFIFIIITILTLINFKLSGMMKEEQRR